ncbi:MAG: aspartate-semialdehyde dehydrogenase [Oscillospiraceae bacterium]|nr:aspartate-semialdehyde dehydrogenase [Oscillospiraceae bacterium]
MTNPTIAILGATGAVGSDILQILHERNFPFEELRCLASARSAGKTLTCSGNSYTVTEATEDAFCGVDIVFGATENDLSEQWAPIIKAAGAVFIDNSSAFRLCPDTPLVIPEVNPQAAKTHKGIIANPNCTTIISLMALAPIARLSPLESITAASYQAVSGAGVPGLTELEGQVAAHVNGGTMEVSTFAHQIAFNVIPCVGGADESGYTSEEMKMQNESRKILDLPNLNVTCTCVRIPVMRSHSVAISVVTKEELSLEQVRQALAAADGVKLTDDTNAGVYPMPINTSGQDIVHVGRIRRDLTNPRGITLFCSGDQVRKGAATNAVQIAELLLG